MTTLQTIELASTRAKAGGRAAVMTTEGLLRWGVPLFVVLAGLILFSTPLRHQEHLLAYAQDDLYYYLIVARNIVHGLGSTFDGVTPSNGYHPLYLVFLLGVVRVAPDLPGIYRALWLLDVASTLCIFLAVRALLSRHLSDSWLANGFAVAIVYLSFWRICQQMEVTLTLPLGFLLLLAVDRPPQEQTATRWAGVGFLASLLTLSRLDSGLLVMLCIGFALGLREYRRTLDYRKIAAFTAGYVPLILGYLWTNLHYFHRLTPISGAAKQLTVTHWPHWSALSVSFSREAMLMFAAVLATLCLLPVVWKRLPAELQIITPAALFFPFLHWGLNLVLSDWMMWPWYRYSLIFALSFVLLLPGMFLPRYLPFRLRRFVGPAILVGFAVALAAARYTRDTFMLDIADASQHLQEFARTHPGRYAMGDRAGMATWLNPNPTIQLEGLMMDGRFLQQIQQRAPLRKVLHEYGIDYYVAFDWKKEKNWPKKCFEAREPFQAGKTSPTMNGLFCEQPVDAYTSAHGRTLVFDVRHPGS